MLVTTSCAAPAGASCYDLLDFFWTPTTDSTSVTSVTTDGSGTAFAQNTDDSFIVTTSTAAQAVRFTASLKFRASATTTKGVYTVTVYTKSSNAGVAPAVTATNKSVIWTVTVNEQKTTVAGLNTYVMPTAAQAEYWANKFATSQDSAIVASAGKNVTSGAISYTASAYIIANAKNSLGETTTAAGTNICAGASCTITATVTNGPGLVANANVSAPYPKTTTFTVDNSLSTAAATETLIVYSDGTAGVSTITFYNSAGTQIGSTSVTFTGAPASATSVSLSDTTVALSSSNNAKVRAVIKDSAGSVIKTGTVYVFASDTNVVRSGAGSSTAAQYTPVAGARGHGVACTDGYVTAGYWECNLTINDTGTASITLSDSWTVAASSWTSSGVTVTGIGNSAASFAVSFDKASYAAGEQAIITITAKDLAGRAASNSAAFTSATSNMSLGNTIAGGTQASGTAATAAWVGYVDRGTETGIETRIVFMPTSSGTLKYTIKYTPASLDPLQQPVEVSATAVITNPAETAANAATAAADAATDAANEAIDAANAATDAANIAAEAADAATVAAEEARDAADAATAAVEELATQVATLMAALSAQVKTLANTVAKIAKKVKA
jgi:hypothetical protein